ncbi:MAG: hypothetical protein H6622_02920 [Halobacteriovoraceae bacterium]|nr:hypothetical protein [Halobacteriovoraceae bacterium]
MKRPKLRKKTKQTFSEKCIESMKNIIFSSQGLPIFLTITILGVLVVLFRMTNVEMEYKLNALDKKILAVNSVQKELKAKKARLLSVKNLHLMANKYNLNTPKQEQIILIK